MGLDDYKNTIVTKCPTIIKHSFIPKNNTSSHPPTITGKKNKIAIVGFIIMEL